MLEIIAIIILFGSAAGMGFMVYRKLPALADLSDIPEDQKDNVLTWCKNKIANIPFVKDFSFLLLLQKLLSKIRVLTLKTENKTARWLQKLREKSKNEKLEQLANDNYWEEIKQAKPIVKPAPARKPRKRKIKPE